MNNEMHNPHAAPQPPPSPSGPMSRGPRAALCAIIPGIGAVYNHDYMKAVVHFSVFACLAVIAESIGIFSLAAFCFYVYTIIDAYRSADLAPEESSKSGGQALNFPLWGSILILMGVLFLLDNLGAIHLRSAVQFWPIILIFLGGYLIVTFFKKDKNRGHSGGSAGRFNVPPSTGGMSNASAAGQSEEGM